MSPWDRRSFAATAYKRLYWQNYKGRFGLFSWPTEVGTLTYNDSERKAYESAFGLNWLLHDLNDTYTGKVRVVAHSMGNVVTSEALRIEADRPTPEKIVHTYVASQAAMAAHAYDAAAPAVETDESTDTPEVYANYPATGRPYYADIGEAADNLINFFNPVDDALGWWLTNQDLKPTEGIEYVFGDFVGPEGVLTFPDDTYDIYAYAAEARSEALGRVPDVGGPFDETRQVNLDSIAFGFGGSPSGHSAQFYSTNMQRNLYWATLLERFGIETE
jgi:hypothetical protein